MANELTITCHARLNDTTTGLTINTPSTAVQFSPSTVIGSSFVVDVGTSEESISLGDVSPGTVLLQNLDTTNYVEFTTVTTDYDLRLPANGGKALFTFSGAQTLYMKANTSACKVLVTVVNS